MIRDPFRLHTGKKLGRYELLAPVARGGTERVWVARLRGARGFHKLVAIKALLPAADDTANRERQLLDEARLAALIQHSNVVQTLELGEQGGMLYLVTEWVDGESLACVMEHAEPSGGVPLSIAVNLSAQTLRGLQAAHELRDAAGVPLGVVHRELSPHTVLISYSGTVKVVDFGVTKADNEEPQPSALGESDVKGRYSSPEQILGGVVDQRSDVFSVGVLLYLLSTGRHPFSGADSDSVSRAITSEEPALRPSLLKAGYSRTLEAVVMKAIDKDRDRRWPSAEEMRLALQRGVPQAFELGFEAQLRTFMADTVGERGLRKREALRRAELVVDARGTDAGSPPSSSSATSLRAIAIDTARERSASNAPRHSRLPSLRPLLARSVPPPHLRRPLFVAFGVVAALIFGLLWLRSPSHGSQAAVSPGTGMVDLAPPRAASASSAIVPLPSALPSISASSAPSPTNRALPANSR